MNGLQLRTYFNKYIVRQHNSRRTLSTMRLTHKEEAKNKLTPENGIGSRKMSYSIFLGGKKIKKIEHNILATSTRGVRK